ncbi:MAG: hypothetical protein JSV44_12590 [Candidatus Zixiibacteriota bacterium]|nr:MAG: hypothetical protein JSV44_12590 [candidate division Zixibacteria bacterium]
MEELLQSALSQLSSAPAWLGTAKQALLDKFGTPGLIAAVLVLLSTLVLIMVKLVKVSFDLVRYVLVPSIAVTFIATYFLPYSFVFILPVSVSFFSVVLLVRG